MRFGDEDGELIGFAEVSRDITARRQAEEELRASERRFRLLVQGVTDYAIFMLDLEGRITNWNAGAERIKGYTYEEIVGEHFSLFYTVEDRAAGKPDQMLENALQHGYSQSTLRRSSDCSRSRKTAQTSFLTPIVISRIRGPSSPPAPAQRAEICWGAIGNALQRTCRGRRSCTGRRATPTTRKDRAL